MYFEEISCPICYSEFDDTEHIPRVIPSCGHTLCLKCLRIILQNDETKKCPLDQRKFESYQETEENFPINYTVKNITEKILSQGICKEHKQLMNLICRTDNCKVCEDCVFNGEHKSHEIETIRNLRIKLNEKKDELIRKQKRVQKFATFANDKFDDHQKELEEMISLKFETLRAILIHKEVQLLQEVNNFFDSEKAKINKKASLIAKDLTQAIATVNNENQNVWEKQDLLYDFSDIDRFLDSQNGQNQTDLEIERIKESIYKTFDDTETNLLDSFSLKLVEQKSLPPQFMTTFILNPKEDILQISQITQKRSLETTISEDMTELHYDFRDYSRIDIEDRRLVNFLAEKCSNNVKLIKFWMQDEKVSDEDLLSFYPIIFWNTENLKGVEANFRNCSIVTDRSIVPLIQNYFFKIKSLRSLSLTLNHTKISPKTTKSLAKLLQKNSKTLEEVKLYFYNTSVTDDSICKLLITIPNIKKLVLSLTYTEISDRILDSLIENVLRNPNSLETLELYLGQTQVMDRGLLTLIGNLPLLKILKLGLECTKVTDNIITILASCLPVEMKSLKELSILISGTLVSQKGQTQLDEIKQNLLQQQ